MKTLTELSAEEALGRRVRLIRDLTDDRTGIDDRDRARLVPGVLGTVTKWEGIGYGLPLRVRVDGCAQDWYFSYRAFELLPERDDDDDQVPL